METKKAANSSYEYDDFEPYGRWRKEENRDILEIHLPAGFAKEHLRVQINRNNDVLTISGECPLDEKKRSRFHKEIKLSDNIKTDEIRAKYSTGILSIMMYKNVPQGHAPDVNGKQNQENNQKKGTENAAAPPTPEGRSISCGQRTSFSWLNTGNKKRVVKILVVVAIITAFGAYVAQKYGRPFHIEDASMSL